MSFNIGLSALNAAQEEIAVTGNNIANASTNGFKASRAEFSDVYAASVLGGGARQGGGGVALQSIAQNFTQGNITFTDNTLDLALNGGGFFVLEGDAGTVYTRAGAFGTDKEGYIVNNSGERLQGIPNNGGAAEDIRVTKGDIPPQGTTKVESAINLDAGAAPSSIIGSKVITNAGVSGEPVSGVRAAQPARLIGIISTTGTNFSGTEKATTVGEEDISGGLNFLTAGGSQGFDISVNGGVFTTIDLSGADTATGALLAAHVQTQLDAALGGNLVNATVVNNRLQLQTVAEGGDSRILIDSVDGLASEIVTEGANEFGKTAPYTGFTIRLGDVTQDIEINQDFTNNGAAARALGGGSGSGNEALEDYIQSEINSNSSLAGRINVSINNLGEIEFVATEAGEETMIIDPFYTNDDETSVNFDDIVTFSTNRRSGQLDIDNLDFSTNETSFTITVGDQTEVININLDFTLDTGSSRANELGSDPSAEVEALEDFVQAAINATTLPGDVKFSIAADGKFVFQITDDSETSLSVESTSAPARATGTEDVSDGFDFNAVNYSFTLTYDEGLGDGPITSNPPITLDQNVTTGADLVDYINAQLGSNTGLDLSPDLEDRAVIARLDRATGQVILETKATGPNATIEIAVTDPAIAPASPVVASTGGALTGSGPTVDFASIATFTGSELDNTGAKAVNNGYLEETIQVVDSDGNTQLLTVQAGAQASEVAAQFSAVTGIAAKGTTVAYITATNRGDETDKGKDAYTDGFVDSNLPLKFNINNHSFETNAGNHDDRIADLVDKINATASLHAEVVPIGGVDYLEITETNGSDLRFHGGSDGLGSITVQSSVQLPDGDFGLSSSDPVQLGNLANRTNDSVVVGGIVELTLDEGVTLTDAERDENGVVLTTVSQSIFGNIGSAEDLLGTEFELNTFDPDNPDTYYRSTAVEIWDTQGSPHTLIQYFVKERPGPTDVGNSVWSVYFQVDGDDVGYDEASSEPSLAKATIRFNSSGLFANAQDKIFITNWTPNTDGAVGVPGGTDADVLLASSNFEIDLSGLTQFGGNFAVQSNSQDGFGKGQLTGLEINSDGRIDARFSNGQSQTLGNVAVASFDDPSKLANIGGTRFAATSESGNATTDRAGTAGRGAIQSGALEDSNVDLSEQLVQLIVSQRNFQAAAQIIESIDTSTQTIINL